MTRYLSKLVRFQHSYHVLIRILKLFARDKTKTKRILYDLEVRHINGCM
jgi:hypothetical protein